MPFRANIAAVAGRSSRIDFLFAEEFAPLRNGAAGGIFMQATFADGNVMTYSVELQEG